MWKRIAAVGVSAGALVATALIGAAPASATSSHYATNPKGQANAGFGEFDSSTNTFYACDTLADSYGVKVDWYVVPYPANNGYVWARGGAGSCASQQASINPNREVAYRICFTGAGGFEEGCTGWFYDYSS